MDDSQNKIKLINFLPTRLQSPKNEDDAGDFEPIINIQKAVYESFIDDIQRQIERLDNRNQMKKIYKSVLDNTKYTDVKDEKTFIELNINFIFKVKKLKEDKKKIVKLLKLREKQRLNHFKKVKHIIENLENKRIELYSQIKELNAKINTIENYKLVDVPLKLKYKKQNELIFQAEQRIQNILNQMEYKSKIHKENLKKEAFKKILGTSDSFQIELKDIVPLTVQRIMQENIILQSQLFRLRIDYNNISNKLFINKNLIKETKNKIKEKKMNTIYQITAIKTQYLLLKKLRTACSIIQELYKSYKTPEDYEHKYLKLLEDLKNLEYYNYNFRQSKLEVVFHQEIMKLKFANNFKLKTIFTLNNVSNALKNLKTCINSIILIGSLYSKKDFKKTDLEAFTFYLLDAINIYESKKWIFVSESVETVADSRNIYAIGDLGFEPKYIEIDEINKGIKKIILKHSISTILKEFDNLSEKLYKQENLNSSNKKSSHDSISIGTSLNNNTFSSQSSRTTEISMSYMKQKEIETILSALLENEEGESQYELQDKYDDYLNYKQE